MSTRPILIRCACLLVYAWLALSSNSAAAQRFPERTIRIIVGLTPGSAGDSSARFLASKLSGELGQPVVVENRPGANGIIGVQAVLAAPADGHTLYLATNSPMSVNPVLMRDLPYRPERDLVPVSGVFRTANMFVVPAQSPMKSLSDLVARARRGSEPVDIATYAQGYWLVAAWFAHAAGIRINNIPYKGMAPTLADVVGNHVGLALVDQSGVRGLLAEGKLRALAITSDRRHPRFPDVPTVMESGYADFVHYSWGGVYAPARTPPAVMRTLTNAVRKILDTQEARDFMAQQGLEPNPLAPEAMRTFHLDQMARYRAIAQAAGIAPQ